MEKLLILANRTAGTLARLRGASALEQYAREAGFEPEMVYTRSAAQLKALLQDRVIGKREKVAIAGGDGTIHSAVQVLAGTDVVLGILPQGTANNFANALRLPVDLPSAFRVIAEGEVRAVDLGQAEDEYFTESAGCGIFADALAIGGASHKLGNIVRALGLVVEYLVTNRPHHLTLIIDGEEHSEEIINVEVANSYCVGYNVPIAPTARVTDGVLDVVIVGPLTRSEVFPYLAAIRTQQHLDLPKIQTVKAKTVEIRSRRKRPVHVDDRAWRRTPVSIRVVPAALRVMVDRL